MSERQLRLLKVIVHPVFVVDNGEALEELPVQPVVVSPADWPNYATTSFLEAVEQLQAQLAEGAVPPEEPAP